MLKRKIEDKLKAWKHSKKRKPLILKGVRQCGKTSSVLEFAHANYEHVIYLNFFQHPEYKDAFAGGLDVDGILLQLSAFGSLDAKYVPGKTLLVFDEIQDCPDARTSLKFFKEDGRYDVIGTGSLLGVSGYGKMPRSVPVGSETIIDMYPMDFEEFLWANGIQDGHIELLRQCLKTETAVPAALHTRMRELLLQYAVVGGMPEVVADFVENKNLRDAIAIQRDLIRSYEDDMVKYAPKEDKTHILECFNSIPRQLAKENKKFQYSVVKKGSTSARYSGCLKWIEDAGIITRCRNLNLPELPLEGNALDDSFKVYMADIGLLISMLEEGTQADVISGRLYGYKGAIFENLIADILHKMGRKLYYYRKDSGMELDFVTRYAGEAVPLEVKAVSGNAKSLRTVLKNTDKYHIRQGIKLGDYNIGRSQDQSVLTLPHYMAFLLTDF